MTNRRQQSRTRRVRRRPKVFCLQERKPIRVQIDGRWLALELIETGESRARLKVTTDGPERREPTPDNLPAELAQLIE